MTVDPRPRVLPQAVLDAMPSASAQLSEGGEVLGVNAAWRTLAELSQPRPSTNVTTGANYLEACERAAASGVAWAENAAAAVRSVLAGTAERAALEYELATPAAPHWFELVATRLEGDGFYGALVTQVDITPRKAAARALLRSE